jgi:hypothetical protein
MIPESQDPYTCGVEIPGPFGIVGGLICFRMSAAVQFDRQPGSWAVKVEDEALEDMLAPKLPWQCGEACVQNGSSLIVASLISMKVHPHQHGRTTTYVGRKATRNLRAPSRFP